MDQRPHICTRPARRGMTAAVLLAGIATLATTPQHVLAQCAPACNKDNVECLTGQAYVNRTSVGRVTTPTGGCCTGWVIAAPDLILTNRHCITTNGQANGPIGNVALMNIVMNHECTACVGGVNKPTTTFNVTALIHNNIGLDFAILRVNGNIAAAWGQLEIDATVPGVGTAVYEIHHAACDSKGVDSGTVTGPIAPNLCIPGTTHEFPFSAIASGGASGAPIFRSSNHGVVGICHCGPPCAPGFGIPMSQILPNAMGPIVAAGGTVNVIGFPGCPGANSCYVAHANPGCNNTACCGEVCAFDPFCCNTEWDGICVNEALDICGNCGDPGAGSCYQSNGSPGCDDFACCAEVCAVDPFCCNTTWDGLCADEAAELCANCGTAAAGNCYAPHPNVGCNDLDCCQLVCAADPFCCEVEWDGLCSNGAASLCGNCGASGAGDCFSAHPNIGCDDLDCCAQVCAVDPFCCNVEWDGLCANEAAELCGNCGAPGAGDCFSAHPNIGCDDLECCRAVCAVDPFCCEVEWDGLCANEAAEICGDCGDPAAGSCYSPHPNVGCDDLECCRAVCALDPFCCEVEWDGLCSGAAAEICGDCGVNPESCYVPHNSVGCSNEACCAQVCAADPFCCEVEWDGLCSDAAATMCAGCGQAGAGNCYAAHANVGCNQSPCCENVCAIDPFCCKVSWDSICAGEAAEICGQCGVNPASCFVPHPSVGCNDADCCAAVCAADPFCCNVEWDGICAAGAATICGDPCPADCAPPPLGDGQVNVQDLLLVINQWGPCAGCPADIAPPPGGDGQVNVQDLLMVINEWGPCVP